MKALYNDGSVAELPQDEVTHVIRHSAAHIMAQAIKRLYPEADFAYGPATDNGFYYDVDLPEGVKISEDDFPAIEAEMKKIVKENLKFSVYEKPRAEAIALMEERGEKYKVEHIGDLDEDARITFYQQGDYIDMCVGPHICYTKALKAFKLTGVSGAYWKGDKDNKMLTRINGVAFATKEELDEHMHMLEEAKKRDHRKIGREMDLFMMRDEAPGFPFFLPNGMILKNTLLDYWREIHHKAGYVEISTPLIMNKQLWKTSGHWDHYKDNMYSPVIAMVMSIASRSFSMENRVPFVFILDEMTTFKVRDFEKLPSVLREYGAAFLLLTQSGAKLEKLYSKLDRSSIEANFGNIFLGRTQDVEALKYYPLFFGKYEKEKKSTSSGSSGGGRNSSVTISTQKEEIYESKDFASLEPGEFIGMGNRSNIKGHFRKKFRLFELEEEPLPVVAFRTEKEISDNYTKILKDIKRMLFHCIFNRFDYNSVFTCIFPKVFCSLCTQHNSPIIFSNGK